MPSRVSALLAVTALCAGCASTSERAAPEHAGNPVWDGWYADPEGVVFGDEYWVYPTTSAAYADQVFLDAFSSPDLVHWTKHERVLDTTAVAWADSAMWAPAAIEKDGRYYLFFAANDIQNDEAVGGIGVAVADAPGGPFRDHLGRPLIGQFHNGAQPIDQFVFPYDEAYYIVYGGWGHANVGRLADDFSGLVPFDDGALVHEITPEGYVEGPFLFERAGRYYFMWSEGGWTNASYRVAYAVADSPFGPFERVGTILEQDPAIATGAGHHSVIHPPGSDDWYIVYHRRPIPNLGRDHRVTAIDRMEFNADGTIRPVRMTTEGVAAHPLR